MIYWSLLLDGTSQQAGILETSSLPISKNTQNLLRVQAFPVIDKEAERKTLCCVSHHADPGS